MYIKLIQDYFKIVIVSLGLWCLCFSLVFKIIPLGVMVVLVFAIGVNFLAVPTPNRVIVETIIGKDPAVEDISTNDNDVIKTIAHRGAGLDAPENSLIAFKMVILITPSKLIKKYIVSFSVRKKE